MRTKLLFTLLFSISICCFAQKRTLTGTVYDEEKNVLANANVLVKNSKKGTITNENGQFTIDIDGMTVLEISYLGFETKEVIISKEKEVSIILENNFEALDTTVVIAYGNNRKISCGFSCKVIYTTEKYVPAQTTLFPNPSASGIFQLQLESDFTNLALDVYNMNGQLVQSKTYSKLSKIPQIDLSKQPKGMYLIRIVADGLPLETKKAIRL
ncbi:carboxypeptidase-like regulatory domain-containing protein [Kordia algicida OT-1]|uniref:Putative outer membrane protein, probably involved in nutrient binding n=1 Tax=Kordia algicida OT-1 TaxID=391587 RepID=A9DMM1_9FLAO|nr:carboxypeptidase-like regulatory domain-containing protein [Kordia algicida]EDP97740.1 putative outer membrane protein, probably involved in nutrient binding [Kordia algicida OT-1]